MITDFFTQAGVDYIKVHGLNFLAHECDIELMNNADSPAKALSFFLTNRARVLPVLTIRRVLKVALPCNLKDMRQMANGLAWMTTTQISTGDFIPCDLDDADVIKRLDAALGIPDRPMLLERSVEDFITQSGKMMDSGKSSTQADWYANKLIQDQPILRMRTAIMAGSRVHPNIRSYFA